MKKCLIFTCLFLISVSPTYSLEKTLDITGNYYCKGYDPFAKVAYEGKMVITKTGDTYAFSSDYGKEATYTGTGFYDPSLRLIVAAFVNPDLANESGVGMMRVNQK